MKIIELNNDAGWAVDALLEMRSTDDVERVDARHLLANGRFKLAVLRCSSPEAAKQLARAFVAALPKKR